MPKLDRNSIDDAKRTVENFLPEQYKRQAFINFICDAISYTQTIDDNNWNLNLDKGGKFLRFNTGHEYCIQLEQDVLLVLCDRTTLKRIPELKDTSVRFMGGNGEQTVYHKQFDKVPDLLVKAKNSVGCLFDTSQDFTAYLDKFKSSNRDFIRVAMKTALMPIMRRAHSKGAVDYLFSAFTESGDDNLPDFTEVLAIEANQLKKAKSLSHQERLNELTKADPKPKRIIVQQTVFLRNQNVVAEVLLRANGHCEQCKEAAPFVRQSDNTPYLEVHHKIRLADGGDDTVENAIALCPNCHRQTHYG
jgi:hypothetical protein